MRDEKPRVTLLVGELQMFVDISIVYVILQFPLCKKKNFSSTAYYLQNYDLQLMPSVHKWSITHFKNLVEFSDRYLACVTILWTLDVVS